MQTAMKPLDWWVIDEKELFKNLTSCEDLTCFHAYLSYSTLKAAFSKLNFFERPEEPRS